MNYSMIGYQTAYHLKIKDIRIIFSGIHSRQIEKYETIGNSMGSKEL